MFGANKHLSLKGLDWLNFLLADVQGGVGPFLAIYLWSSQGWDARHIGIIMTIAGIATVAARAPAGALVDWTVWKRALIVIAAGIVALGAIALSLFPLFWPVAVAQTLIGICDAAFPPAIAAISLGIVGRGAFTKRVGRNKAFNHAGNVLTAIIAGIAGYLIAPGAVLWLVALLAAMSALAALSINAGEINHPLARGLDNNDYDCEHRQRPSALRIIFECKPLLTFTAAITLFHFANAAMLPLVGERLSQGHKDSGSLFIAACIVAAQAVMVPIAMLVGAKSDKWGRKPLFLLGFAALPIRGLLYTLWDNPYYLVAIQLLDGIGAGVFGALFFIVIADLTKGTGHYNLALGAAGAAWGAGAALSNSAAGLIVDAAGFTAAFLFLAGVAALAFLLFRLAVPETGARSGMGNDLVGRLSRGEDSRMPSNGGMTTALIATVLVATGALVFEEACILAGGLASLAIHAAESLNVGFLTRHVTWGGGTGAAAVVIFLATYLVVAIGKLPGYQLDRAGAALVGASLMVGVGVVSLDQAYRAIDFDAITLLLGMMIVVANLRLSGFFRLVSNFVVARAPSSRPADGHCARGGLVVGVSRQRYDLSRLDPAGARPRHQAKARSGPLPLGDPDGLQHRQHSDDHRQSTEYDRRQPLAYILRHVRRGLVASCGGWRHAHGAAHRSQLPSRLFDQQTFPAYRGQTGTLPSTSGHQIGSRDHWDDDPVLRRPTGRQGGDRRGCTAAAHAQGQGRQGLSRDRLAAASDVRRPLYRRHRIGSGRSLFGSGCRNRRSRS
jgi:MFS family permease